MALLSFTTAAPCSAQPAVADTVFFVDAGGGWYWVRAWAVDDYGRMDAQVRACDAALLASQAARAADGALIDAVAARAALADSLAAERARARQTCENELSVVRTRAETAEGQIADAERRERLWAPIRAAIEAPGTLAMGALLGAAAVVVYQRTASR